MSDFDDALASIRRDIERVENSHGFYRAEIDAGMLDYNIDELAAAQDALNAEAAIWDDACATCAYGMTHHGGCPAIAAILESRAAATTESITSEDGGDDGE